MPHDLGPAHAATPAAEAAADRRTVRRVAAFSAAAVAVTALATAGVAHGTGTASATSAPLGAGLSGSTGAAPMAPASPTPVPSGSPSTAASPSASPATAPQLKIQISYNRVGRDLTLTFNFGGFVVEPLAADGAKLTFPTPAKRDIGLGETLSWGDGTNSDVPVTGRRCPAGPEPRVVHEIQDTYKVTKKYTGPGTYTVNYSYAACGLAGGKISGTLTVTIPK